MSDQVIDTLLKERDRFLNLISRASPSEYVTIDTKLGAIYRELGKAYMQSPVLLPSERLNKAAYYFNMSSKQFDLVNAHAEAAESRKQYEEVVAIYRQITSSS